MDDSKSVVVGPMKRQNNHVHMLDQVLKERGKNVLKEHD